MGKMRSLFVGTAVVLIVILPPCVSTAQSLVVSPLMGEELQEDTDLGFAVFLSLEGGITPYTMTYEGNAVVENLNNGNAVGYKGKTEYVERFQRMYSLGATFGVHWALLERLVVSGGMGASYLNLQDVNNDFSEYTFDLVPSPGFSAFLGVSWEPLSTRFISGIIGLQTSYLSTFGLSGYTFENREEYSDDSIHREVDIAATDTEMHLITIQPYLGFQWRPVQSFATNSFGIYYSGMISLATMTQEVRNYQSDESALGNLEEDGSRDKKKIDLWVKPLQPLGAYYGWYFNIPHSGTIGVEVQLGNRWSGSLSYLYRF